ncbi:GNAT family N-acetyltransferase [Streptomyces sp. BE308]|uniref:GNAT family N-acetyltransferase n=1 Tax=Streptomyces sp. BE308 TaxID=3002529 RepID=UPI002E75C681|nr:GNAT family N-acetyltransferase [Streptomyces sp. BE308]MEE1789269.1 GNAT family N-acetyltransferase [Streptomyces sp. BE308]
MAELLCSRPDIGPMASGVSFARGATEASDLSIATRPGRGTISHVTNLSSAPAGSAPTRLSAVPYDHPDAHHLTRALHLDQVATYGFAEDPGEPPAAQFDPPQGLFLIAHHDGGAVGCGGIRLLDAETAEIKRMYVKESARGNGLGRRILEYLERHAAVNGATQLLLETGCRNHDALALYQRCGYTPRSSYVPGRDPRVNRALTKRLGFPDRRVS